MAWEHPNFANSPKYRLSLRSALLRLTKRSEVKQSQSLDVGIAENALREHSISLRSQ